MDWTTLVAAPGGPELARCGLGTDSDIAVVWNC